MPRAQNYKINHLCKLQHLKVYGIQALQSQVLAVFQQPLGIVIMRGRLQKVFDHAFPPLNIWRNIATSRQVQDKHCREYDLVHRQPKQDLQDLLKEATALEAAVVAGKA